MKRPRARPYHLTAKAWAIRERGRINVRTVQDTRVGAMVNWLCTDGGLTLGAGWNHQDDAIEFLFEQHAVALGRKPRVVEVLVAELS